MITISYPKEDLQLEQVLETLKNLSLAHKTIANPEVEEIQLNDGLKTIKGEAAIQAYLEDLADELGQWYYCSC